MNRKMYKYRIMLLVKFFTFVVSTQVFAAEVLPVPSCAEGWVMEGKVVLYNKENLFERINGESELYFPYGFTGLAYARYKNNKNPQQAVEADVYRMGSLLDAFGLFSRYRRQNDAEVAIGGGGTISSSQMFFYQDRYLVRLQATGVTFAGQDMFLACARAISLKLPNNPARPKEIDMLAIPAVVPKSVQYFASSLLGYDFFHQGFTADAIVNGEKVQLFLVLNESLDAARKAFGDCRSYLKKTGEMRQLKKKADQALMRGSDPVHGTIVVEQTGRFVFGVIGSKDQHAENQLIDQLRRRVSAQ